MVPPTTNSPEGVSKPHGMPAPPLRFLSRIPRDSLPNLNVPRPLLFLSFLQRDLPLDTNQTRRTGEICPLHIPRFRSPPGGDGKEGGWNTSLRRHSTAGRDACPAFVIEATESGWEEREERKGEKEGEWSRGTFGTEKLRKPTENTNFSRFFVSGSFTRGKYFINDSVCRVLMNR